MPTFFGDDEIAAMFQDFGVECTFDGITYKYGAIVDYVDAVTLQDMGVTGVINKSVTAMMQTSKWPSLMNMDAVDKQIVIDGVGYTVRQRLQQSDGALTHLLCVS